MSSLVKLRRLAATAAAFFLLTSCAETRLQLADGRHPASFRTGADADLVTLDLTNTHARLRVVKLNHTAPTDARGRNIAATGTAVSKGVTAAGLFFAPVPVK